jgi:hypothetical protein
VTQWLLRPDFNLLGHLNACLLASYQDEGMLLNLLWTFGNLLGELNPVLTHDLLTKTDLLDFMCQVQARYAMLTPTLMKILPWLCQNIIRLEPMPKVEIIQIVLRVVDAIIRDLPKLKS